MVWCGVQVVLNATTLGHILLESTDQAKEQGGGVSRGGSMTRKISAALKALGDFSVLKTWISDQVEIDLAAGDEYAKRQELEKSVICDCFFECCFVWSFFRVSNLLLPAFNPFVSVSRSMLYCVVLCCFVCCFVWSFFRVSNLLLSAFNQSHDQCCIVLFCVVLCCFVLSACWVNAGVLTVS